MITLEDARNLAIYYHAINQAIEANPVDWNGVAVWGKMLKPLLERTGIQLVSNLDDLLVSAEYQLYGRAA